MATHDEKPQSKREMKAKRIRRSRPFPSYSLEEALAIAQSIANNNACKPYSRLSLAESIDRAPGASQFRDLITSSAAYGLTEGSYGAMQISLTTLGLSIVAPKSDEEKQQGLITAAMNIELFKQLYKHYDQHKLPSHDNFKNTLIRDYNLDSSLVDECIDKFEANGKFVGLIRNIAGADHVSMYDANVLPRGRSLPGSMTESAVEPTDSLSAAKPDLSAPPGVTQQLRLPNQRVFIAHGKKREIVDQLKDLVTFGKFIPVVAQEHETPSKPVPDKVLEDMRSCFAGIIHVASEDELLDREGNVHHKINENVLIEIGAAMALYKRNFILLVQKGIHLPSNLQGLYLCEYEGEKLDYDATMKLLKAFNEFK